MPEHTLKLDRAQKPPLLQNITIPKKGDSIWPQLQVTTQLPCLLLRSGVQKALKEEENTFFSQDHIAQVKQSQCLLTFIQYFRFRRVKHCSCSLLNLVLWLVNINLLESFPSHSERKDQFWNLVAICST